MAEKLFEVAVQKTTAAAAGPVVSIVPAAIAAGVDLPEIREIRVSNQSGVAAEIGLGLPAAIGTGAITGATVQRLTATSAAGATQVATSFATTQPTAPANPYRREELQGVAGALAVWVWGEGEFRLWSGAAVPHLVIWQYSLLAVTFDVAVKVEE